MFTLSLCCSAGSHSQTPWMTLRRLDLWGLKLTIVWASSPTLSAHRLPIHISVPCKHGYYRQMIHNSRVLRSQSAKGVSIKTQPSHCGGKSRVPGVTVLWSRTGRNNSGEGEKKNAGVEGYKVIKCYCFWCDCFFPAWLLDRMLDSADIGIPISKGYCFVIALPV